MASNPKAEVLKYRPSGTGVILGFLMIASNVAAAWYSTQASHAAYIIFIFISATRVVKVIQVLAAVGLPTAHACGLCLCDVCVNDCCPKVAHKPDVSAMCEVHCCFICCLLECPPPMYFCGVLGDMCCCRPESKVVPTPSVLDPSISMAAPTETMP